MDDMIGHHTGAGKVTGPLSEKAGHRHQSNPQAKLSEILTGSIGDARP